MNDLIDCKYLGKSNLKTNMHWPWTPPGNVNESVSCYLSALGLGHVLRVPSKGLTDTSYFDYFGIHTNEMANSSFLLYTKLSSRNSNARMGFLCFYLSIEFMQTEKWQKITTKYSSNIISTSQISHFINITHRQRTWKHMIGQTDSILRCYWLVFGLCMAKGHVSMLTYLMSNRTTIKEG